MIFIGLFAYLFVWLFVMFLAAMFTPSRKGKGHH